MQVSKEEKENIVVTEEDVTNVSSVSKVLNNSSWKMEKNILSDNILDNLKVFDITGGASDEYLHGLVERAIYEKQISLITSLFKIKGSECFHVDKTPIEFAISVSDPKPCVLIIKERGDEIPKNPDESAKDYIFGCVVYNTDGLKADDDYIKYLSDSNKEKYIEIPISQAYREMNLFDIIVFLFKKFGLRLSGREVLLSKKDKIVKAAKTKVQENNIIKIVDDFATRLKSASNEERKELETKYSISVDIVISNLQNKYNKYYTSKTDVITGKPEFSQKEFLEFISDGILKGYMDNKNNLSEYIGSSVHLHYKYSPTGEYKFYILGFNHDDTMYTVDLITTEGIYLTPYDFSSGNSTDYIHSNLKLICESFTENTFDDEISNLLETIKLTKEINAKDSISYLVSAKIPSLTELAIPIANRELSLSYEGTPYPLFSKYTSWNFIKRYSNCWTRTSYSIYEKAFINSRGFVDVISSTATKKIAPIIRLNIK